MNHYISRARHQSYIIDGPVTTPPPPTDDAPPPASSTAPPARAYKSASSRYPRAPAASANSANPPHAPAYARRTNAAAHAATPAPDRSPPRIATCFSNRKNACRVNGRAGSRPGNSQRIRLSDSATSAAAASFAASDSGTIRSLPPFPRTITSAASPASAVRGSDSNSLTRKPVAYRISNAVRATTPGRPGTRPAAASRRVDLGLRQIFRQHARAISANPATRSDRRP